MSGPTTVPCGLYLHVPLCPGKCGYCDFYSIPAAGVDASGLVERLVRETRLRVASLPGPVGSIFVGGGTPTVLAAAELAPLLEPLGPVAARPSCREFTVEANPATLDQAKAGILADAGVTRLSLGAQSFHQAELAALERVHSPADIAPAAAIAREAGIRDLNLDLIFGIPGQTLETWRDSLDRAMDLEPDHLALYGLTYESGTPLTRRRDAGMVTPCDEELEAEMYRIAVERVCRRGLEQYEISNFARPGRRCLHNLAYWFGQPYVGIGPSAVGCVDGVRYRNVPDVAWYVRMIDEQGDAVVETESLDGRTLAAESVMLQLRLVEGIDRARFERRTGLDPLLAFAGTVGRYKDLGMVRVTPERIALTDRGRLLADGIIADFMTELDRTAGSGVRPAVDGKKREKGVRLFCF